MNTATVSVIIEAKDQASAVLKQVEQNAGGLGGALSALAGPASIGLAAVAAAGAGVAAGLGAAVAAAAGFESTMSGVKAVSGATASEMDGLSKLALQLGKDTSFSASEAGKAIEELVKGGLSIADVMGGGAKAALDLAAAGSIGVADAAEIAANAVGQFGLKGEQLGRVADMIAGAANASTINVTDFKFSMAAAGAVANTVGFSFDDLAVAISEMGKAGIKGSDAGTSLKTFMMNLNPSTKQAKDAMKELGLYTDRMGSAFFDAQGKVKPMAEVQRLLSDATKNLTEQQKLSFLQTIFGTDAIRAAAVLAKEGAGGFNEMADSMGKVTAAAVGAERLNNLKGSLEQLKGSVETAAITIGLALTPALKQLVDVGTNLLNAALPGIEAFATGLNKTITKVFADFQRGGVGAVGFDILKGLGLDDSAAKGAIETLNKIVNQIVGVFNAFQIGGPANGAVSILRMLGLSPDQIGPVIQTVQGFINQVGGALASLGAIFSGGDVQGGFLQLATIINQAFGPNVEQMVIGFVQGVKENLDTFLAVVRGVISAFQEGGWTAALTAAFGPEASGLIQTFISVAGDFLGTIWTVLSTQVIPALNEFRTVIGPVLEPALKAFALMVGTELVIGLAALIVAVVAATEILGRAGEAFSIAGGLADLYRIMIEQVATTVTDRFSVMGGDADLLRIAVGNAFDAIGTAADKMVTEVAYALMQITNKVRELAGSIGAEAAQIGNNLVGGLLTAIKNGIPVVAQAAWDLARSAVTSAMSALNERSDSKEMYQVGVWYVGGFIRAIQDRAPDALAAAETLGRDSVQALAKFNPQNSFDQQMKKSLPQLGGVSQVDNDLWRALNANASMQAPVVAPAASGERGQAIGVAVQSPVTELLAEQNNLLRDTNKLLQNLPYGLARGVRMERAAAG